MEVEVGDWFCADLFGKNAYARVNDIDRRGYYYMLFRDGSGGYKSKETITYFLNKWNHVKNFELMDILYGEE